MKSITLHKLDPSVAEKLENLARERGQSLNRTAQELLRSALGLDRSKAIDPMEDFRDLFGKWTEEEFEEFNRNIADLEQIDPSDWE